MNHPLLLEINTRCWLHELSSLAGRTLTLAEVPAAEFVRWTNLGFTHLWLMGVWETSPRSRAVALETPELRAEFDRALPDWRDVDVAGSPYAIAGYRVSDALGGEAALKQFRQRLLDHGLKLVLDFIPNHLGLDHPWLREHPEFFVQSPSPVPESWRLETEQGAVWIAHGKDPHFPAWTDTAQLDYRRIATREAVRAKLESVAARCDGVRCDMAMLVLNDVFASTWAAFPGGLAPEMEFWAEAIVAVKRERPDFLLVAEAYWGLEARLQTLGFDFTYDKPLCDLLSESRTADVPRHLLETPPGRVEASVHFLENHDEPRIVSRLDFEAHRAAALVVLGLPGLRLLHDGQITGARIHTPVQLARRLAEPPEPNLTRFYQETLTVLADNDVGRGQGVLLRARSAWPGNATQENFVLVQWQTAVPEFDLVVVNLSAQRAQCYAPLSVPALSNYNWSLRDLLGTEVWGRFGTDLERQGLYLDIAPFAAQLFHFQPIH
jgi:hypothetical protein